MHITTRELADCTVVSATGHLTGANSVELLDVLLKVLAEQPPGIVCDLTGVRADMLGLTFLRGIADQVAAWPGVSLVVCAPDETLRDRLHALGLTRRLVVADTLEAAHGSLSVRPEQLRVRRTFAPQSDAAAAARAFARHWCHVWEAPVDVDPVQLVVDELVTNAVRHGGTDLEVRLTSRATSLGVAVADRGPPFPARTAAAGWTAQGRGLVLVHAVSDLWGVVPRVDGGKVVWATLRGPVPSTPAPRGWRAPRQRDGS